MLCYKDRAFCFRECANTSCHRHLSEEIERGAKHLGLPLSLADFRTFTCGYMPRHSAPEDKPGGSTRARSE